MFEVNVKSRAGRQQKKIKMSEDFLLKWNDHHTLFFAGAGKLYQDEEFTDVTFTAGSKFFKAHKLVLSICSPQGYQLTPPGVIILFSSQETEDNLLAT